jgi:hypothetical protein
LSLGSKFKVLFLAALVLAGSAAEARTRGGSQITDRTLYVGLNVSALEQGSAVPGTVGVDFPNITDAEMDYYRSKNLTTIRLPFKGDRLQQSFNGSLDTTYLGYITAAVAKASARGMTVILDDHDFGSMLGHKVGDGTATPANFADLWTKIVTVFGGNPAIVGYDIMNEPNGMPNAGAWPAAAQAAVTAIRLVDANTPIYVEGDGFSSAFQWLTNGNDGLKNLTGTGIIYSAHAYADYNNSGSYPTYPNSAAVGCTAGQTTYQCAQTMGDQLTTPISVLDTNILVKRVTVFANWCQTNGTGRPCHIGESGVANDDPNWLTTLDNELAYLSAKNVKMTYWAAGGFFGTYPLGVEPQASGGDTVQVAVLTKRTNAYQPATYYFTGPARGTASVASSNFTVTYKGYTKAAVTITPNDNGAGGTFTPSTETLAPGFNPVATFTYTAPGTDAYKISLTNSIGWTDPAPLGYATISDMFSSLSSAVPENIFSLRKVYAPYAGPAINLRRASDNATQDFNFTSIHLNAPIDSTAIAAWANGSNVFIVKQYDQGSLHQNRGPKGSADSNGDSTPVNADQPQLILTGTNPNAKPEIVWSGSGMDAPSPINGDTALTVVTTMEPGSTGESRMVAWDKVQNYDFPNGGFMGGFANVNNGVGYTEPLANDILDPSAWHTYAWRYQTHTTKGMSAFKDGILVQQGDTSGASAITYQFRSTAYFGYFIFSGGVHFTGHETETFVLNGALTDAEAAAIDANQASYYGTTTATPPTVPTPPSIDTTTPSTLPMTGVNSSELEFGPIPGALHSNYFDDSAQNGPYLHSRSLLTVRMPIQWARMQQTLSGSLDATYLGQVQAAVQTFQAAGENIIIDAHNYGGYGDSAIGAADLQKISNGTFASDTVWAKGSGVTISGGAANITASTGVALSQTSSAATNGLLYKVTYTITASAGTITPSYGTQSGTTQSASGTYTENIRLGQANDVFAFNTVGFTGTVSNVSVVFVAATQADFVNFWTRMADAFPVASYPKVNFDLMNEPHLLTPATMGTVGQAAINAIRGEGFTNWIAIEGGGSFASCQSFVSSGWAAVASTLTDNGTALTDPAAKILFECHAYLDSDSSGSHATCTQNGSTALVAANTYAAAHSLKMYLGEFGISTDPSCVTQGNAMLDYMVANDAQWRAFTAWTDGAYALTYMFMVNPAGFTAPIIDMPVINTLIAHRGL